MQSFRTEFENPIVEKDIIDLERKIRLFREGKIDEEKFRSLRLARGVYGQRQAGVQMIRIKIPFGKLSARQLVRIADISDEYASSTLHATTRQDIQIHYVSLDRTPELWAKLEEEEITLREACGNTVRNITASHWAGIDPNEPFDVSPYAYEMFKYFLRNPVCQEMGRKFKIAFSSAEHDSAFTFIHDLGFIPLVKTENGVEKRGFKVLIGGGLGAQPYLAQVATEWLEEDRLMPFTEAVLRIFDRYGERKRRHKARLKFLLEEIGLEELLRLASEEEKALKVKTYQINRESVKPATPQPIDKKYEFPASILEDKTYQDFASTNVFKQKQEGFVAVSVRVPLGNITSDIARKFAKIAEEFSAADDIRITIQQNYLLRFVRPEALPALYLALKEIGLHAAGADSTADITACPGTDTCNLGISSSTGISKALEKVIHEEFPDLIRNNDIKIKISGCPNSCGQHGIASIGFHGSSLKSKSGLILPALQVLLGGRVEANGNGKIADKVLKIPSKRGTDALRLLLRDYENNALEGEYFSYYYERQGEMYFYNLLKPLTDLTTLTQDDYLDWFDDQKFELIKAVGECAGVIIDLFATLLYETEEKLAWAKEAYGEKRYADAIYHAYNTMLSGAKALLLSRGVETNSQHSVMKAFDKEFVETGVLVFGSTFSDYVTQLNKHEPTADFAALYLQNAQDFLSNIKEVREREMIKEVAVNVGVEATQGEG
jgi:sulfite reductase (ferredoxin)